jgi:uncharacterized protein
MAVTVDEHPHYVFDSFALFSHFLAEPGGPKVREILRQAERNEARISMAVVNVGELFYKTAARTNLVRADQIISLVREFPIQIVDVDWDLTMLAAKIKVDHRMSYADCMAAALAQSLSAVLVTGDPEFNSIEQIVSIEWLPQPERT